MFSLWVARIVEQLNILFPVYRYFDILILTFAKPFKSLKDHLKKILTIKIIHPHESQATCNGDSRATAL